MPENSKDIQLSVQPSIHPSVPHTRQSTPPNPSAAMIRTHFSEGSSKERFHTNPYVCLWYSWAVAAHLFLIGCLDPVPRGFDTALVNRSISCIARCGDVLLYSRDVFGHWQWMGRFWRQTCASWGFWEQHAQTPNANVHKTNDVLNTTFTRVMRKDLYKGICDPSRDKEMQLCICVGIMFKIGRLLL